MAEPAPSPTEGSDASDGSMETILASIRRIIQEDEAAVAPVVPDPAGDAADDDTDDELMVLEPSMMVPPKIDEEVAMPIDPALQSAARTAADLAAALFDDPVPVRPPDIVTVAVVQAAPAPVVAAVPPPRFATLPTQPADATLMAPQTRTAAAQSIAALQEAVRPEPAPALHLLRGGGPTIEDMVREELRTQLKHWLDANLPELVERVVRQEIEGLVRPG